METVKANNLIDRFVGNQITDPDGNIKQDRDLKYHISWNELIPVVRMCKERQLFGGQYLIKNIDLALLDLDIERLHVEVVVFIQWYNENK